jgi:hypothetical protein
VIHPAIIQHFTQTGTGNMGDVTDVSSIARIALPGAERYVLATFRALFTGGAGSADLVLKINHRQGVDFQFTPVTWENSGTDGEAIIEYRVAEDELYHLIFLRDRATGKQDVGVFDWTNPDPGNMRWSWEAGLIDVADLPMELSGAARIG